MVKDRERPSTFVDKVQKSIECKFSPGQLRDQFVKLLVWDGMTTEHRAACTGMKTGSIDKWICATQDLGSLKQETQVLATTLQNQNEGLAETLAGALQAQTESMTQALSQAFVLLASAQRWPLHRAMERPRPTHYLWSKLWVCVPYFWVPARALKYVDPDNTQGCDDAPEEDIPSA